MGEEGEKPAEKEGAYLLCGLLGKKWGGQKLNDAPWSSPVWLRSDLGRQLLAASRQSPVLTSLVLCLIVLLWLANGGEAADQWSSPVVRFVCSFVCLSVCLFIASRGPNPLPPFDWCQFGASLRATVGPFGARLFEHVGGPTVRAGGGGGRGVEIKGGK